jgi:hypothetical protein
MKLRCTVVDYCRIMDFQEPEEVVNVGGYWTVKFIMNEAKGKPYTSTRRFHSKTYADDFLDLLRECDNVSIVEASTFHAELVIEGAPDKLRLVNVNGSVHQDLFTPTLDFKKIIKDNF